MKLSRMHPLNYVLFIYMAYVFCNVMCQDIKSESFENKHILEFVSEYKIINMIKLSEEMEDGSRVPYKLRFNAYNKTFTLTVFNDYTQIQENMIIEVDNKFLSVHEVWQIRSDVPLIRGHVDTDMETYVFGKLYNEVFDGFIRFKNGTLLYFEPLQKYQKSECASNKTVIYRSVDLLENRTVDRLVLSNNLDQNFFSKTLPGNSVPLVTNRTQDHTFPRRSKRSSTVSTTCSIHVYVDHTFFQSVGGSSIASTVAEIKYQFGHADMIFRGTDFDGNGEGDNIGFDISQITIFSSAQSANYKMSSSSLNVYDYLDAFSEYNHDAFCLGVAFSYREFDNGLVGLAWVASSNIYGPVGGICQKRVLMVSNKKTYSYNTAMVTMLNHGKRLPSYKAALVLAHELGHSFGSPHDDESNNVCSPNDKFGNYVMYPYASNGGLANNDMFSMCSVNTMYPVLLNKGNCLIRRQGPYCGNGVTEQGEECDCGNSATCEFTDNCCTPPGSGSPDPGCTFRRSEGKVCSPRESPCCNTNCTVVSQSANRICGHKSECLNEVKCNGISPMCPTFQTKPNDTECDGGRKICQSGICFLSICEKYQMSSCQCEGADNVCVLCCQNSSFCLPLYQIIGGGILTLSPGESCLHRSGFCDNSGKCITGSFDSAINRLKNAFSEDTANDTKEWIKKYWYYVLIGIITMVILVIIFVKSRRKRSNVQAHAHRMGRFDMFMTNASLEKKRQSILLRNISQLYDHKIHNIKNNLRCREITSAVARLSILFPTVDREVLTSVARQSTSESVAVKMLLIRRYPLRRLIKTNSEDLPEACSFGPEVDDVTFVREYGSVMRSNSEDFQSVYSTVYEESLGMESNTEIDQIRKNELISSNGLDSTLME